ncbi:MAG: SMP-30/gluconolactonase/LRE family protein [Sphingomonadales bacterium]|nr:SMP-30/gluconolactonase/LRE family protein [Sphingomonadales bacterium]MDE2171832.1 SMP-30/gluconolactonase/LRE family protein [Sphingomonadales bacterium]
MIGALSTLGPAQVTLAQNGAPPPRPVVTPHIERMDPALDALVDASQPIERVATGFVFTEGPMWYKGRLFFSDVRDDKMYAVTPEGKVELLNGESGGLAQHPPHVDVGSNGAAPTPGAISVVARMGARDIARMDAPGQMKPYITHYQGKRLNSPNDVVYARDGALWFTDPPFGLNYLKEGAKAAQELPFAGVFRYDTKGKLTAAITDMPFPNGIGISPDGKTLYVDNWGPEGYLRAYDLAADGTLSNMREVIRFPGQSGPDGLKIDMAGNIWMTGPGGIRIITPKGKVLGQIKLPETAANLAFAQDGHTLYITASTSIYRIHTKVAGELPRYMRP